VSRENGDLSLEEAEADFAADVRRLNQAHQIIGWTVARDGVTLMVLCSCDHRLRAIRPDDNHYVNVIRALRGPVRKAK
jgi:hypothetical protein